MNMEIILEWIYKFQAIFSNFVSAGKTPEEPTMKFFLDWIYQF